MRQQKTEKLFSGSHSRKAIKKEKVAFRFAKMQRKKINKNTKSCRMMAYEDKRQHFLEKMIFGEVDTAIPKDRKTEKS